MIQRLSGSESDDFSVCRPICFKICAHHLNIYLNLACTNFKTDRTDWEPSDSSIVPKLFPLISTYNILYYDTFPFA